MQSRVVIFTFAAVALLATGCSHSGGGGSGGGVSGNYSGTAQDTQGAATAPSR